MMRNGKSFNNLGLLAGGSLLLSALFVPSGLAAGEVLKNPALLQIAQATEEPSEDVISEEDVTSSDAEEATPETEQEAPKVAIPEIITDLSEVPFPVRKMRELILEAARSGDIEKLRPYIGYGDDVTMLSLGGFDEDPIDFLKSLSGDSDGHEIMAIMTEILEAPFVKIEEQSGNAVYVWPYFYSYPFDELTPRQRVQLFRIITYGDYEEMLSFGSYIFYRLGITPEGRWRFFVAGD
ncbi:MAG: cytoplasmic protein [Salaquimonas sp.]